MKDVENNGTLGRVSDDVAEYVSLRIAAFKLAVVEVLSHVAGNALRILVLIVLCSFALMAFTVALIVLLSELLNSVVWAAAIIGAVYVLAGIILFPARKLFTDPMVKMFSRMIFKPRKDKDDEE